MSNKEKISYNLEDFIISPSQKSTIIGQGSFSKVFLATHKKTKKKYAIKMV